MLFVSLLLRPWLLLVTHLQVQPRALADDLLLVAVGPDSLVRFSVAFQASIHHLLDLGGRVASMKSTIFSNSSDFRHWLSRKKWDGIHSQVPVVTHLRDLGSSLAVGNTMATRLSKACLQCATCILHRVFRLPHQLPTKLNIMRATCHATALYACEASQVDEHGLANYTSQVVRRFAPNAHHPSHAMVFTTTSPEDDDPSVIILVRRVLMLRRMCENWPQVHDRVTQNPSNVWSS